MTYERPADPPERWLDGAHDALPCCYWLAPPLSRPCGAVPTRLYLTGACCWDHTPAAVSGRPDTLPPPVVHTGRAPVRYHGGHGGTDLKKHRREGGRQVGQAATSHMVALRPNTIALEVFQQIAAFMEQSGGLTAAEVCKALGRPAKTVLAALDQLTGSNYLIDTAHKRDGGIVYGVTEEAWLYGIDQRRHARRLPGMGH